MAYFEILDTGSNEVIIRFRELGEAPSAYNWYEIDIMGYSGNGSTDDFYIEIPGDALTYYSDGAGKYKTSDITLSPPYGGLTPGTTYRMRCFAHTNDIYPIVHSDGATYGYFDTLEEDIDVPYPVADIESISGNTIRINWYNSEEADSYDIYLNGTYYTSQDGASARDIAIRDLAYNTTYSITMTAWLDGTESNYGMQYIAEALTGPRQILNVQATNITSNSARISWSSRLEATEYRVRLRQVGVTGVVADYYSSSNFYNVTGLLPGIEYYVVILGFNSEGTAGEASLSTYFTTLGAVTRPLNWAWEYTIASGQPFYTQSGSSVYIMRAAHWNAFTAKINEFRIYKLGTGYNYSFTTALTSHTPSQIRACINQAIAAINGMGFSQASVLIGNSVAASTFTTMRNNLNSL